MRSTRHRFGPAVLLILIAGCSSVPTYTYTRLGATQQDVSRDTFECMKDIEEMHRGQFAAGPLWFVAAQQAKGRRTKANELRLCMEGKGYTATEP